MGRQWISVSFIEEKNDSELLFCLSIVKLIVIHSVSSLSYQSLRLPMGKKELKSCSKLVSLPSFQKSYLIQSSYEILKST